MRTKVKTKINAADVSQITGEPVNQVIEAKLNYIIDRVQNEPPHIMWVTKNAFMWGSGKLFGVLNEDNPIRTGFITTFRKGHIDRGHLPIRKPSDAQLQVMERNFGVALDFPPPSLFNLIQHAFRNAEKRLNKPESPIRAIPCRGYINEENKLIQPNWNRSEDFRGNAISGYFIFRVDAEGIEHVKRKLLDDSDIRFQLQFERARFTTFQINETRMMTGEKLMENALLQESMVTPILNQLKTNQDVQDWDLLLDANQSKMLG